VPSLFSVQSAPFCSPTKRRSEGSPRMIESMQPFPKGRLIERGVEVLPMVDAFMRVFAPIKTVSHFGMRSGLFLDYLARIKYTASHHTDAARFPFSSPARGSLSLSACRP